MYAIRSYYDNLQALLKPLSSEMQFKKFSDKIEVVAPIEVVDQTRQILLDTRNNFV